ncbi:MAG: DEAD/DEAH box helicase [Acidimicrobiales bacterium]
MGDLAERVLTLAKVSGGGEYAELLRQLGSSQSVSAKRTELVEGAIDVWRRPGFDSFAGLSQLRFEPFQYQLRAAAVVLRQMGGRAILADEVGLGKTIEAGIVITELRQRGLARRVLVLAPTGLVGQWCEELERKFAIPAAVASREGWSVATQEAELLAADELSRDTGLPEGDAVVVASLATARREALRERLSSYDWDLVVVDEAHRIRNPRTASSQLVRALRARHMLLLTATPVENRLDDLFHLVALIRPGHLGTIKDFRRRYGTPERRGRRSLAGGTELDGDESAEASGQLLVRSATDLRANLRAVMVRHRRSEVAMMLPRRLAETVLVTPFPAEAALYGEISERVRRGARDAGPSRELALRTLQQLAGSSPRAVGPTLERLGWFDLAERARETGHSAKTAVLGGLLDRHEKAGEKVIVFTAFKETLAYLCEWASATGRRWTRYHGSLARRDKEAAIADFEHQTDVLLSTESAGEGRNLQFCHAMVNFDLPWNPMRIEQRLGRIHRIGQTHDVMLTNVATRGTLEEHVLQILHAKLNLFELVVGELDMVLGRVNDDFVFEEAVFEAHVQSNDDEDRAARLAKLGDALAEARLAHGESRDWTDRLVATLEGDEADDGGKAR